MTNTPNLSLPYLAAAQAQKHVTVNEALSLIDALAQMAVVAVGATTPPATPAEGERHIIGAGATGAWSGWDNSIALFSGGAWLRLTPQTGWMAWDVSASELLVWNGNAWIGLDAAMNLLTRASSVRVVQGLAGSATDMVVAEELLSNLSGASVASTIAIPNRAIVLGVSTRTVTAITGATSYDCGIAGEISKFGGSLGVAAGSTNVGVIGPQAFYAPTPIILTANGGSFSAGAARISIHYFLPIAPQS